MQMTKRTISRSTLMAIFTPVISGLFPIIALLSFNIQYTPPYLSYRVVAITIFGILLTMLFAFLLSKNIQKSAIFTSLLIISIFGYGHLLPFAENIFGKNLPNDVLSFTFFALLLISIIWLRKLSSLESLKITNVIFVISAALVIYNLFLIASFEISQYRANQENVSEEFGMVAEVFTGPEKVFPDIYHIVLDAHTRSDVIKNRYGYDNSSFIDQLSDMGFFIGTCSQTNYWQTDLSMGSTFRMDYLQDDEIFGGTLPDWGASPVFKILRSHGYQVITYKTRITHNNDIGEDILISRSNPSSTLFEEKKFAAFERLSLASGLNDFELTFFQTTWFSSWLNLIVNYSDIFPLAEEIKIAGNVYDPDLVNSLNYRHYLETLFVMEDLPNAPKIDIEGPKFVYIHIASPHEPFIFNANGDYFRRDRESNLIEGYRNNIEFLDSRFGDIIKSIIEGSDTPPLIIIQGDHGLNGTAASTLLPILNAYYLPSFPTEKLYESISPVNTYRQIFDHYFGIDLGLLEDKSFVLSSDGNSMNEIANDCSNQ